MIRVNPLRNQLLWIFNKLNLICILIIMYLVKNQIAQECILPFEIILCINLNFWVRQNIDVSVLTKVLFFFLENTASSCWLNLSEAGLLFSTSLFNQLVHFSIQSFLLLETLNTPLNRNLDSSSIFIVLLEYPLFLLSKLADRFESHPKREDHHLSFILECMPLTTYRFDMYSQ